MANSKQMFVFWTFVGVVIALVLMTRAESDQIVDFHEISEYEKSIIIGGVDYEEQETVTTRYKGPWSCDDPEYYRTCRQGIPKLFGEIERQIEDNYCPAKIFKKFLNCVQRFVAHCVPSSMRQSYWLYNAFNHMSSDAVSRHCNETGLYYKSRYLEHAECIGDMEDVHKQCKLKTLMRSQYFPVSSFPGRTQEIIHTACKSFRRFVICVHEKTIAKCGQETGSYVAHLYNEIFFKIVAVCQNGQNYPGKEANRGKKNENRIIL